MSEAHWCQCESCTQERVEAYKRIAELEQQLAELKRECQQLKTRLSSATRALLQEDVASGKPVVESPRSDGER